MTVTGLADQPDVAAAGPGAPGPALVERIRRGVVGGDQVLADPSGRSGSPTPTGSASGRALDFVEDAIRDRVLPWYANTHTESSGTGRHTTRLREQARQVIHQAVGGTDEDLVILCGSGATAAVAKLAGLLELDRHGPRLLHHELVVAMLNDLFGIQARGGCSCAGPYGHRLLGIGPERSRALSEQAGRGYNGIKPGWVRLSFNYFIDDATADFLVEAVDLLATSGHRLLDAYRFDPRSGQWRHRAAPPDPVVSLTDLLDGRPAPGPGPDAGDEVLSGYLEQARAVLAAAGPAAADPGPGWLPPELERLREFHLPPA